MDRGYRDHEYIEIASDEQMRVISIILVILAVQAFFFVMVFFTIFGNGASRPDPVSSAVMFVGFLTTPLCIAGFIAFYTTQKFQKVGFWVFCSFIAVGWCYVAYHQALGEWVSMNAIDGVILMAAFTIAVGVGLAKASHSEVRPNEPQAIKSGSFKEEFIYREFRVFVKNDFYRYGAEKFETVEAAKAYIDSFMDGPK